MITATTSLPLLWPTTSGFTQSISTRIKRETEASKRALIWRELQEIVNNPVKHRDYLLTAAMIQSREREMTIE
jgi:hypothetical protein